MNRPEIRREIWKHLGAYVYGAPIHELVERMGFDPDAATEAEIKRWQKAADEIVAACWHKGNRS